MKVVTTHDFCGDGTGQSGGRRQKVVRGSIVVTTFTRRAAESGAPTGALRVVVHEGQRYAGSRILSEVTMEPVVRAIDVGYGNTKYVVSAGRGPVRCAHFPSIAPVTSGRDLAAALGRQRRTVAITIGDLTYEVGPDAALADDLAGTRHMDDDYIQSPEYLALARGALHLMREPAIDLLVVGLPVSTFALHKTSLEKRMSGLHDVGGGRTVTVRKVRVLAQPHGALMHFALSGTDDFAAIKAQRHLIIDVGARTFDWLVGQGLKTVDKRSGAVNRGMHDVLRAFADAISKSENTLFNDYDRIDRALRGGVPPIVFQKEYDLERHLPAARKIVRDAVTELKRVVQDGNDIDNVLLGGGGAFFFGPVIREAFPRHTIRPLKDTLYANVIGFQLAGIE
ncbi:PRTRC system protein D [Actimicrobium sp. CCI2.3]|uniref:PRTRC system protein D n=1 Tax=Actimicrobium sp. CCI2.3 TaxID=3048616 RepID=UPI002AB3DB74|nr:PRTRC system protein D [Actimicrobium sp. CCI2.3]MDY7574479.1 PRTRC system protein D [Actimicrobium sp. CCI2.3]MEB0023906.1 PRTRC system protein D [Actimicrobium sp. CCI2.3]